MTLTEKTFETITCEIKNRILYLTLNRPDRLNAFNPIMCEELIEVFSGVDADDEIRVVLVTGAGRGFCAGADLSSGSGTFASRAKEKPDSKKPARKKKPATKKEPAAKQPEPKQKPAEKKPE